MKTDTFNFSKGANNNISLIMTKKNIINVFWGQIYKVKKTIKNKESNMINQYSILTERACIFSSPYKPCIFF
jgi:hypothetical protein